ncbi:MULTISPECIES: hypothetical protein [Sphingomonas]|jgi:hypothetical protein|uniref:hypothetical protein n=1 Tax=Sphingomonas TaxID=13687 RepID=UPI0012ECF4A6|nr:MULTISPECIES: hypothetical protein [Sphingomonas]
MSNAKTHPTDRENKLNISKRMIEEGAKIIRAYDSRYEDEASLAEAVYVTMLQVRIS